MTLLLLILLGQFCPSGYLPEYDTNGNQIGWVYAEFWGDEFIQKQADGSLLVFPACSALVNGPDRINDIPLGPVPGWQPDHLADGSEFGMIYYDPALFVDGVFGDTLTPNDSLTFDTDTLYIHADGCDVIVIEGSEATVIFREPEEHAEAWSILMRIRELF